MPMDVFMSCLEDLGNMKGKEYTMGGRTHTALRKMDINMYYYH
jgi:hypothetical protein